MKPTKLAVHPKLKKLHAKIGGKIYEDGELYYGSPGKRQIFIHTIDGKNFELWSQRPLYTIRNGNPHLVKARSAADAKGWYCATVAEADVEKAIHFALAHSDSKFAYEDVLHHYCANHLEEIERDLTLYQRGRISGLEVNIDGRYIDILAVDAEKNLVVIETKRSQAKKQTIDQILKYIAWVRKHIAKPGQRVRGIIIAPQISGDLKLASSGAPEVELLEYQLSVQFRKPVN